MQRPEETPQFRKAAIADVRAMHRLINEAAARDELLARPLSDIYEKLRDFHVSDAAGGLAGCCALHIVWEDIAEVRSLAVDASRRGLGIGSELVRRCLEECSRLGVGKVFVLTYIPPFFQRFGFREVAKDTLPHKVWADCLKCPKFPDCGEIAMLRTTGRSD